MLLVCALLSLHLDLRLRCLLVLLQRSVPCAMHVSDRLLLLLLLNVHLLHLSVHLSLCRRL